MSLLKENTKSGVWIPLVIAASLVIAVIIGYYIMSNHDEYDSTTLCSTTNDHDHTVILLDQTGGFSHSQARLINRLIDNTVESLPTGERLSFYELEDVKYKGLSDPMFDRCKPKQARDGNSVYENKKRIDKRYTNQFEKPLLDLREKVSFGQSLSESPLIESIYDLSALMKRGKKSQIREIILVSDLLQHTNSFSFYRHDHINRRYKGGHIPTPDLSGIKVTVLYIVRSGHESALQNNNVIEWWERYLLDANAVINRIVKVR